MSLFGDSIISFSSEYRWLSNFYLVDILFRGYKFPSVENAYVAAKTSDHTLYPKIANMTPGQAKRFGRTLDLIVDWDKNKFNTMKYLVTQKFENDELREKLLATGDVPIIEGNTWGDTYWGQCPIGTGENRLGKIIMKIRDDLRK